MSRIARHARRGAAGRVPHLNACRNIHHAVRRARFELTVRRYRQPVHDEPPLYSNVAQVQEVVTVLHLHAHAQPAAAVALHAALREREDHGRLRLLDLDEARVRLAVGEHEAVDAELRIVHGVAKVTAVAHHLQTETKRVRRGIQVHLPVRAGGKETCVHVIDNDCHSNKQNQAREEGLAGLAARERACTPWKAG